MHLPNHPDLTSYHVLTYRRSTAITLHDKKHDRLFDRWLQFADVQLESEFSFPSQVYNASEICMIEKLLYMTLYNNNSTGKWLKIKVLMCLHMYIVTLNLKFIARTPMYNVEQNV